MRRQDRAQAQTLEAVMQRYEAASLALEANAVADLRNAGFYGVTSMRDARARLKAQRKYPTFEQVQIDIIMHREAQKKRKTS